MAHFLPKLVLMVAATAIGSNAMAADSGEADAVKLIGEAVKYIKANGIEKATAEFNNLTGPFNTKSDVNPNGDMYVFSIDFNGFQAIHGKNPKIRGQNTIAMKDVNGVEIIKTMVTKCKNEGKGWVSYVWPNPSTKVLDQKQGYVERVPGMELCMGTGIFKPK